MNQLQIDTGVEEWRVNRAGILRFNPADPALYARFVAFCEGLEETLGALKEETIDENNRGTGATKGASNVGALTSRMLAVGAVDARLKAGLCDVFGPGNDFNALFEGVSLLGITTGGTTVLENLLAALQPVLQKAASEREAGLKARAGQAVEKAKAARKARGNGAALPADKNEGANDVGGGAVANSARTKARAGNVAKEVADRHISCPGATAAKINAGRAVSNGLEDGEADCLQAKADSGQDSGQCARGM